MRTAPDYHVSPEDDVEREKEKGEGERKGGKEKERERENAIFPLVSLECFGQTTLPRSPGHSTFVRFGLDEATARVVRPSLLTDNATASAGGSAGLGHEWDPVVDAGAGSKGAGKCFACFLDDNDSISIICTSIVKATSVIASVCSPPPEYKQHQLIIFIC